MHSGAAVILVSNNTYRLGPRLGAGTRPRVDDGLLGITILAGPHERSHGLARFRLPWRQWNAPTFVINSDAPVPVGVDGESMHIAPPLQFTIRPGVLRVRIAPQHPGASPSAAQPEGLIDAITMLWHLARDKPERRVCASPSGTVRSQRRSGRPLNDGSPSRTRRSRERLQARRSLALPNRGNRGSTLIAWSRTTRPTHHRSPGCRC